jgi:N-acylmannosamine kinase
MTPPAWRLRRRQKACRTVATDRPHTAIDLGGTKIAAARILGGRVLDRRQIATPRTQSFEPILEAMARLVDGWIDGPVAVATTGLVDGGCLTAVNPQTLALPVDFPIEARLAERLGVAVRAINDAQAAAWGEFRFGAGRGTASMVFLTVSTGVGGGLVLDGAVRTGPRGLAGHIGHVVAAPDGPFCGCGRRGCLEAVAAGPALAQAASRLFRRPTSAEDLFAASADDRDAAGLVDDAAAAIARVLGNLKATLDLDLAVIGGGVGLASRLLPRIEVGVSREPDRFRVPVVHAALGHDAGLIGACDWAIGVLSGRAPNG